MVKKKTDKKIKFEDIDFGDCDEELEVITKEEAQKKVAQNGEGRTVIIRGKKGELLLSSNKDDADDINNLFNEMDDLIHSVKDY